MAYEDLSTFTEVDNNNHLSSTTTRTTSAGLTRQEDAYVYKDYTANYFDALDIDLTVYEDNTNTTQNGSHSFAITNTVDDRTGFAATDLSVAIAEDSDKILIYLIRGNFVANDSYTTNLSNTIFYLTLERSAGGDTVTCKIYSDAARTNLLDTLTVSGFGTVKWQYLFSACSTNTGSPDCFHYGYVENIDLNLATTTTSTSSSTSTTTTSTSTSTSTSTTTTSTSTSSSTTTTSTSSSTSTTTTSTSSSTSSSTSTSTTISVTTSTSTTTTSTSTSTTTTSTSTSTSSSSSTSTTTTVPRGLKVEKVYLRIKVDHPGR